MGWFSRPAPAEFWRVPPFRSPPEVLHQHGITSVGRRDGRAMMSVGWAIWQQAGLHAHQATDFLKDGYALWRQEPGCTDDDARRFCRDLREQIDRDPPPIVPQNPMFDMSQQNEVAGAYYGTRSWAAAEEWSVSGHLPPDQRRALGDAVLVVLAGTHPAYLAARSSDTARALAEERDLPDVHG